VLRHLLALLTAVTTARAQDDWAEGGDDWGAEEAGVEIHGFAEMASGSRVVDNDLHADDLVMNEARFRLDLAHAEDIADLQVKADFLGDAVDDEVRVELRQATATVRAARWLDLRAGYQVLTWGTGDFVFLNDLFPKDFVSFFIGRDDEFLKVPSLSVKLSLISELAGLDLVWTPIFAPDRSITGDRLSFFSPAAGQVVAPDPPVEAVLPDREVENGELAARLHRDVDGLELALYGYLGYFKQPRAFDPVTGLPFHSRLGVYGASARSALLGGIAHAEGAFYHSRDDEDGTDPTVPNSHVRGLLGYERELVTNVNVGLQYYLEWLYQHDELIAASPTPEFETDEVRDWATVRLTWRLLRDTLVLSMFTFVGVQERDTHLRPRITYRWSDALSVTAAGNIMIGDEPQTFFGQLEDDSNASLRLRYAF